MTTGTKQRMSTSRAVRLLCLAIALVLVSCIGASALQTDFGRVQVTKFNIPTGNGKWISGHLFKPVQANENHRVPMVITSHGLLNNNQMQDITGIELSRRGIAVMAMDAYCHGDSSLTEDDHFTTILDDAMGMIALVEYAHHDLDYVDQSRIGVTGHSMGGMNAWSTLYHYGGLYSAAMEEAQKPGSEGGAEVTEGELAAAKALNKVSAGFLVSMVGEQFFSLAAPDMTVDQLYKDIHANVGINLGSHDENSYVFTRQNADLSGDCPESLAFVNYSLPEDQRTTAVEIGKFYGSLEDETFRVVYNPNELHIQQHFSSKSSAHMTEFFTTAFQMENPIPHGDQLWLWKELFNFLGLIGSFLAIVPMAVLLLRLPCFAGLQGDIPPALPALTTPRSKAVFWGCWAVGWIVPAALYMQVCGLDRIFFPSVAAFGLSSVYPQMVTNFLMLWSVFSGILGLLLFLFSYHFSGKKNGVTPEMWGIRTNWRELLKTLALAVCVFIGFYSFVMFSEYFFQTDFRIWTVDIRAFTADKVLLALQYWPFFFIFYAANSITVNSANRVGGQKEWVNLLICGVGNSLAALLPFAHQYAVLYATGITPWAGDWLRPLALFPLIFLLFLAAIINRYLFRETGKVWLGAMVNCLIIVMLCVANTVTFGIF